MYAKKSNPIVFAKVGTPVVVDPTLAMTPAQMDAMAKKGIPISTANLANQYFDGNPPDKCSFDIPVGDRRGVDIIDAWQAQKDARQNLSKAAQMAAKYGSIVNSPTNS